jgi:hypothetical protein
MLYARICRVETVMRLYLAAMLVCVHHFIPFLMEHLGEKYYAGLLSAGEYHGAAHQRPQVYQVVTARNGPQINCGRVRVQFIARKNMEQILVHSANFIKESLMKCIGMGAINFIWPIAVLVFLLACDSGSQTGATVVVTHDTSTIAAGVDHISYAGLDAGGNTIYGPIELDKADSVVLTGNSSTTVATGCHATEFDPERLAIVDQKAAGNILVRGNLPMITNSGPDTCLPVSQRYFAFNELNSELKKRLGDGFDLNAYEIIVMTLIDNESDLNQFTAELQGFGLTPQNIYDAEACSSPYKPIVDFCSSWAPSTHFGTTLTTEGASHAANIIWWPIYACGNCETNYLRGLDKYKLIDQPTYLKTLLNGTSLSGKPRLIYFHCMQGTDRTGALHALYMMENDTNLTLPRAFEIIEKATNSKDILRPACVYAELARYYCLRVNNNDQTKCAMPLCRQ